MKIQNKIKSIEPVKWRELKWLQVEGLKRIEETAREKQMQSIRQNGFLDPFKVWVDEDGTRWILDGCHRQAALKGLEAEGLEIPDALPATSVECRDRKHAASMVLVFTAQYAKLTEDGLKEFIEEFDLDVSDILEECEFTDIDIEDFELTEFDGPDMLPGDRRGRKDQVFQYNIIFSDQEEYEQFIEWLKGVKRKYSREDLTISEMILAEVKA